MGRKGWGKKGVCIHFPIHVLKRKYINFWSQGFVSRAITGVKSWKPNLLSQCLLKQNQRGIAVSRRALCCFGFASVGQMHSTFCSD